MNPPKPHQMYPLSSPQREIWFDQMLHPESPLYNIGGYMQINGTIDARLFETAINLLVQRHDTLRSQLIPVSEEVPIQIFLKDLPVTVPFHDFSGEKDSSESALSWMQEQLVQPFDLYKKQLYHTALLKISDNCFYLFNKWHHLIIDGWGISLLTRSLSEIYTQLLKGQKIESVALSYIEFIKNDRAYIESDRYELHRRYWTEKYQTLPEPLFTRCYLDKFVDKIDRSERQTVWLPRLFYNKLLSFAKNTQSTLFHVMLGALYVYFTRTTQREDFAIGLPVLNRSNASFKETVGLFVGVSAAWFKLGTGLSFRQLLKDIGRTLKSDYRHQRLPISELNRALGIKKIGRMQLFDIQLNYAKHHHDTEFGLFKTKSISLKNGNEQTPLSISIWEFHENEDVQVDFVYNLAYFDTTEIERIQSRFMLILEYALNHVNESISTFPLLPQAEYQQIVIEWNKTDKEYPKDKTIYQLFEEQVLKTPDSIAVVFENQQLTYHELNQKTNQVANYIQTIKIDVAKKQSPNDNCPMTTDNNLIALCLDRSLEMIIGILGIMKAGGAYVPIDPEYPAERINYILNDTQTEIVLTQSNLVERLQKITNVNLIELDSDCYQDEETTNLLIQNKATDLVYVIYTSGTTGKPKGVIVENKSVVNTVKFLEGIYKLSDKDRVTEFTSYVFDVSVSEIFITITQGASLHILSNDVRSNPDKISKYLDDFNITYTYLPPVILEQLPKEKHSNLKSIIYAGEPCNIETATYWSNKISLFNIYGPTESTIYSSYKEIKHNEVEQIGKPINNTRVYIVGHSNNLVPQGVIGELHIGGAGLARGYLNQPELTTEKFIPNPFATKEDIANGYTRLYKTGDLARWLPYGNLEYIGRNDFQVKIRGYRIEPGEIENTLKSIENIKQACVLAKEKNGNKYLVGYFVSENSIEIAENHILVQLSKQLPDYMIPAVLVQIETFPLTINGKLDKKALPDPEFTDKDSYVEPTTDLEIKLCNIWQEVLKLEKVGITDDFFRIGGDSILAIKLTHQISKEFDSHIAVADIFKYKTVSSFVGYLNSNETKHIKIIPQNLNKYPLSFAQQRLWFIEQYEQGTNAYHIPMLVELKKNTDKDKLKNSIQQIIQRHEVLRTIFKQVNGEYYQIVVDDKVIINEYNNSEVEISKQIERDINTPFDLEKEFPLRVSFYHKNNTTHLLVNIHHIASDGWSMDILLKEINNLYHGKKLLNLVIQYKDFANWQREYLQGEVLQNQLTYWQEKLQGYEPLALPTDKARPKQIDYTGDNTLFTIDGNLSNKLRVLSKEQGCSMYTTLLSGFYILLSKYTSQNDIVLGTPIANRQYSEIKDLIGFFINSLVLREHINQENSVAAFISQVQNNLIETQRNQDLPFEKIVEELKVEQDTSRHPIFQVMFGMQFFGSNFKNNLFKFQPSNKTHSIAKYDLTCFMDDSQNEIQGGFSYTRSLYEKPTIERMVNHYLIVLEQMVSDKYKQLKEYSLLTQSEYQQIVIDWNKTDKEYPKDKTICQLFEEQVEKTPDNIAVIFEEQQLTYKELNQKANQLAHYLCDIKTNTAKNSKPNDYCLMTNDNNLIGICVERSLEMVIGLLGILKAGGAYVPLDPSYPSQRLQLMLQDSQVEVLLSQSHLLERLPVSTSKVVCLDSEREQITGCSGEDPVRQSGPENLAYVIYTSGSTGAPKGVMVKHIGLTNLILAQIKAFDITQKSRLLQFASFSFDASVSEIGTALTSGATLQLGSANKFLPDEQFIKLIKCQSITHVTLPPSFLATLPLEKLSSLETLVVAGEACSSELVAKWSKGRKFINAYGPTESTVCATLTECQADGNPPSIGKPIANTRIYILDKHNNPTPPGIPGELCIAGIGLAAGYLNRSELTDDKFIEIELFGKHQRIYKTGDSARWLSTGNIEYLGRLDNQVKLRGFRIELSEIEVILMRHETVKQAVAALYHHKESRLAVYVTLVKPIDDVDGVLRTWLKTHLPEYMLPSGFTVLEQLPLTPNGKIDRKALPEPDAVRTGFVAPQTSAEQLIADIWQELLGINRIGIHDDFFDIGGNSLDGMRFINKLNEKTGEVFYIYVLFEATTIAKFVDYLKIHYPKLMSKMDDSYSLPEITAQDNSEKITAKKLEQFRQLLPESNFNSTNHQDKNPPAIFIFAPPRSGTTLLRVILGGHPGLFDPPEMELLAFNSLKERYARCMERDSFWLEGAIRALMEIKNCDVEEARQLITAYEQKDLDIKEFYKVLQTEIGNRVLVDKTPFYALDINILKQAEKQFDNAVYIHLLRHPYGMIHSFEKARLDQIISGHPYAFPLKALAGPGSLKELAELFWLQCHQNILEFLQTIPTSRQYALKFEELVDHPQPVIESICKFLKLPFHPNMLQPYQEKKQRMTDGLHVDGNMLGDIKFHAHQQIDAKVAKGWKKTYKEDFLNDITWDIAEQLGYQRELGEINIPRVPEGKPLPLSFPQQRLWFLAQLEGQSATYNMPAALRLTGRINETALKHAFIALVERHDILRLCFPAVDGEPTAQLTEIYNPLKVTDLSGLSESEQQHQTDTWIKNHTQAPFDLNTGPLLSTRLLKLNKQEQILLFNMHHIISDGWSIGVLIREWSLLYNAYIENRQPQLPELTIQFTDYAAWQRDWLQGEVLDEQFTYWNDKLAGASELLKLPTDYPRPAVMRFQGKHIQSTLDQDLTQGLNRLSRQQGVTLFMTLLAAFNVLLSRYTGQTDLALGSPIANRTHHQTEDLIGFFVNTLVLRTQIKREQTFLELLKQIKQTALEAYSHQDIPFEYLVEQLNPSRSMSHTPLFQVMFILQNAPKEKLELNGLTMSFLESQHRTAKFDLTVSITEQDGLFICDWEYNTDLFHSDTITRMGKHFQVLLDGILTNPEQSLSQLPLLTKTEQQQLMIWNQTEIDYPKDKNIVDLFHEQVEKTPDNIAIVFEEQQLTYRQLNRKSNQLANYLLSLKNKTDNCPRITDNCFIGIVIERSMEMVIGLLGILKAGAVYVPLDPDYPQQRLQFMLEDSKVPVLLTQERLIDRLPKHQSKIVCLDGDWKNIEGYSTKNPTGYIKPDKPAYVIYTSGSTGKPKGVLGTHNGMVNRLNWMWQTYPFEAEEVCCHRSSINFVDHIAELFSPLLKGVSLVLLTKEEMRDTAGIINILYQSKITRILLVPSLLRSILEQSDHELQKLELVKYWFCSGEHFPTDLAKLFHKRLAGKCLLNIYGSSEVSADVMAYRVKNDDMHNISIGRPISNTQTYILDESLKFVPVGVPGELYVGGVGLALGYLNRPELTAKRFIKIEMNGKTQRLYKTGDLARWLPTGNIEYLGRIDHQVKLRGYRIEPGEIEVALNKHPDIHEAAVIIQETSEDKRLLAYFVPLLSNQSLHSPATFDNESQTRQVEQWQQNQDSTVGHKLVAELRDFLKQTLPEYMIPSAFIPLESMPLTPNGKADRKALSQLSATRVKPKGDIVPPQTPEEELLVTIWADVLGIEQVSIFDNFFDSGGHSLLATRLVARICESFEIEMPLRVIFEQPTVHGLAQSIVMYRQTGTYLSNNDSKINFCTETTLEPSIQPLTPLRQEAITEPELILLTGSTGFLGAHLLHELLTQTNADIICLVRYSCEDGICRIRKTLESYSLWNESFSARIIPIVGDLAKPFLGISKTEFNDLANRIDVIYHNGAWVNHIYPYQILKAANVSGTLEILKLATRTVSKPVHYISSLSCLSPIDPDKDKALLNNIVTKVNHGYLQSKWVAEQLVQQAGERGIPISIFRPQRIIGHSKTGISNQNDFISLLMKGCIQLKMMPDLNCIKGNLIPVDYTVNAIVHLSRQISSLQQTYEITNTQNTNWKTLFNKLRSKGYKLEQTPYEIWREKLSSQPENALFPLLPLFPKEITEDSEVKNKQTKQQLFNQKTDEKLAAANIICPTINDSLLENYFSCFIDNNFFNAP